MERFIKKQNKIIKMTTAHFTALNIEFEIPWDERFHDDGFVESTTKHARLTYLKHLKPEKAVTFRHKTEKEPIGFHMMVKGWFDIYEHHHIFYKDMEDDAANILLRAHEETHALQMFNRGKSRPYYIGRTLDMIAEDFPKARHISNPFGTWPENNERIAEILGAYAAMREYGRLPKIIKKNVREEIERLFL